jgi:hypothetical protein
MQIAVALLKTHMGVLSAARSLSREGLDKLQRAAVPHPRLLGLDLQSLTERFVHSVAPLERNELPVVGPEVPALELELQGARRARSRRRVGGSSAEVASRGPQRSRRT